MLPVVEREATKAEHTAVTFDVEDIAAAVSDRRQQGGLVQRH
jgi:hypothetical protein